MFDSIGPIGPISVAQLLVPALAFFLAGLVKGTLGVGLPMVAIPITAMVLPPAQAIALTIAPILFSNLWQAVEDADVRVTLRRFWPLILTMIAGIYLGGRLLATIDVQTSTVILGVVLIGFCLLQLFPLRMTVPARWEVWLAPLVGLISGVIGGFSGMYGLGVMLYLLTLQLSKNEFVGSVSLIYLFGIIGLTLALAGNNLLTLTELAGSVLALLPLFAGMVIGRRVRHRLAPATFRRLLILMLFVLATSLIVKNL